MNNRMLSAESPQLVHRWRYQEKYFDGETQSIYRGERNARLYIVSVLICSI